MKTFASWLVLFVVAFGGFAGGYHLWLGENPRRVVVVVDASFPMQAVWPRIPQTLAALQHRPYSVYALETDKSTVHAFADRLSLGGTIAYAPRNFDRLKQGDGLLDEADEVILVTNASAAELDGLPGWKVVRP